MFQGLDLYMHMLVLSLSLLFSLSLTHELSELAFFAGGGEEDHQECQGQILS